MTDTTKSADSVIEKLAEDLQARFKATGEKLGRANDHLWSDLGKVYEQEPLINGDKVLRAALNKAVQALPDVPKTETWKAANLSTFACLLILAAGYEDKTSDRTRYRQALDNAKKENVAPTEEAFVEWVKGKHGITNAAKAPDNGSHADPLKIIEDFKKVIPDPSENDLIPIEADAGEEGLAVWLVRPLGDGQAQVLKKSTVPRLIAAAITTQDISAAEIQRKAKLAIWDLNNWMAKETKVRKGKADEEAAKKFMEAVTTLGNLPTAEKYFDGAPKAERSGQDFKVFNEEVPRMDPARYIENARPGALIPYDLGDSKPTKESMEANTSFMAYRENPPRRRSQAKLAKAEA